eukprot:gene3104-2698_t
MVTELIGAGWRGPAGDQLRGVTVTRVRGHPSIQVEADRCIILQRAGWTFYQFHCYTPHC